jgi:FkbM family methyltransferase
MTVNYRNGSFAGTAIATLRDDEVMARNRFGQRLIVNKAVASSFRRHGCFDWLGLSCIEKILTVLERPVALDIGANIGNHTVVMARHCARVLAFEPQLATGIRLADNVRLNGLENVELYNFGLSDRDEEIPLFIDPVENSGSTTFCRSLAVAGCREVRCRTRVGDQLLQSLNVGHVDLVKIDVEGFEAAALAGLRHTLLTSRPIIFSEWNNSETRSSFAALRLFDEIFSGWSFLAIHSSHSKLFFRATAAGRMSRLFHKMTRPREAVLSAFDAALDYSNVIFCPPEKLHLLQRP